jgi:mono/diheme cytochrome c family protein
MKSKLLRWGLGVLAGLFVLLQAVPYGRAHRNPPVVAEPSWDRPETRALAVRACYDCHSNETKWPWYSHVAPISWLVQRDVDQGRTALNFSEWNRGQKEAHEAAETVQEGEMPLRAYLFAHPEAHLSGSERQSLVLGLSATLGLERPRGESAEGD